MNKYGEFSEEQSEELISHLKSGGPSEFEHLRSALNLLAHVTELPPTSIPPVLPSGITQPIPVLPMRSRKPRRTLVTTIMVIGLFGSASLAAATVTGIGPAVIVNVGHQAAKFVKGVAGAVSHVVTGNPSGAVQNQGLNTEPALVPPNIAPTISGGDEENSQPDSERSALVIPSLSNLFPPVSTESDSRGQDSQKPNSEESPGAISGGGKEQSNLEDKLQPTINSLVKPSSDSGDQGTNGATSARVQDHASPTPEPTREQASPTPEPTSDQASPTPEPTSDQTSENG